MHLILSIRFLFWEFVVGLLNLQIEFRGVRVHFFDPNGCYFSRFILLEFDDFEKLIIYVFLSRCCELD